MKRYIKTSTSVDTINIDIVVIVEEEYMPVAADRKIKRSVIYISF